MNYDLISRQAAIEAMAELQGRAYTKAELKGISKAWKRIKQLPSAQPEPIKVSVDHAMTEEELKELKQKIADSPVVLLPPAQSDIIRCNACKHWTQTTGNMPGFGLGDCDYLNAKLVNCNGYCYWAERREENDQYTGNKLAEGLRAKSR